MGHTPPEKPGLIVASHEMLFVPPDETLCDACGRTIEPSADGDDVGAPGSPGRGVYLWTRGGESRLEHVPLCAGCASAIGVTALARWEIEEEEG